MPVNTPRVRIRKGPGRPSPETGYAYLDARARGHRRGPGLRAPRRRRASRDHRPGEHAARVPARARPRVQLPRDGRPRHPRRGAPGVPRLGPGPGHRRPRGDLGPDPRRGAARTDRRSRAGAHPRRGLRRLPRRLLQHRPQVRRGGRARSPTSSRSARSTTGSSWGRSPDAACASSGGSPGGRVPTSAAPLEVVAFRLLPSGRLADLLTRGEVRVLQVPHRRGRLTVVTPGLVRRAHAAGQARARVDDRRPRRDAHAARPWCRRTHDRPDRHTPGRAHRGAGSGGDDHDRPGVERPGIADLRPLVRMQEQRAWYWYDWANSAYVTTVGRGALRAVPDLRRRGRAPAGRRPTTTRLQRAAAGPRPRSLARLAGLLRGHASPPILSALVLPIVGAVADRSLAQDAR